MDQCVVAQKGVGVKAMVEASSVAAAKELAEAGATESVVVVDYRHS